MIDAASTLPTPASVQVCSVLASLVARRTGGSAPRTSREAH
jgi:hypothetical protein